MARQSDKAGRGMRHYVVKSATRAQIKAARMLLARERAGLANPSDKARAVAQGKAEGHA